jgi:hypothetical protein
MTPAHESRYPGVRNFVIGIPLEPHQPQTLHTTQHYEAEILQLRREGMCRLYFAVYYAHC